MGRASVHWAGRRFVFPPSSSMLRATRRAAQSGRVHICTSSARWPRPLPHSPFFSSPLPVSSPLSFSSSSSPCPASCSSRVRVLIPRSSSRLRRRPHRPHHSRLGRVQCVARQGRARDRFSARLFHFVLAYPSLLSYRARPRSHALHRGRQHGLPRRRRWRRHAAGPRCSQCHHHATSRVRASTLESLPIPNAYP